MKVEGGACSTQEGKHGSATCVVTVDQQTYADVVQGKQKPEQAFMAGKIKASNLGDMMKFGSAFDMKKAKQLAEQHQAAPAAVAAPQPLGPAQVIGAAFRLMPQVFVPERAKGWNAVIHFDITDGTPYTVSVQDGACSTQEGKHGDATCVVTVDQQTYADVVQGKQKPEQAFMAGEDQGVEPGRHDEVRVGLRHEEGQAARGAAPGGAGGRGGAAAPGAGAGDRGGVPADARRCSCRSGPRGAGTR
ncbi:MAG: SCP2 sterol-binding domain-containing protein [Planctomycetota bacterium]